MSVSGLFDQSRTAFRFFYSSGNGIGEYVVPVTEAPPVLLPDASGAKQANIAEPGSETPSEWVLRLLGARHVVSLPIAVRRGAGEILGRDSGR